MEGFLQILVLLAFIGAGAALPRLRIGPGRKPLAPPPAAVDLLLKLSLWALLAVMGFRLGNDPELAPRLAGIGLAALTSAVAASIGTVLAILGGTALLDARRPAARVGVAQRAVGAGGSSPAGAAPTAGPASRGPASRGPASRGPASRGPASRGPASRPALSGAARLKAPALLISFVAGGFALGSVLPPIGLDLQAATGWILDVLLVCIGMQFSQAGVPLRAAFLDPRILVTPLATALGSLAGGLAVARLLGLGAGKAMALVGGFGWYSLSGALIANLGDPALGSAAFLSNMIRESLALVAIPFLAASRRPELAIGLGGATAMDVTLPLIERGAGPAIVPASFASGAILSLAVPLLVPALYRLPC